MSKLGSTPTSSAIQDAIRAKREGRSTLPEDIEAIERSLLADIEAFDLDAAERRARHEQSNTVAGLVDPALVYPAIAPEGAHRLPPRPAVQPIEPDVPEAQSPTHGNLLDQLRHRAAARQREQHSATAERNAVNETIDQALRQLFLYLHDFVQQLNILKPDIPRPYALVNDLAIGPLAWQEGFADYRTQSHAAGSMVEQVSCTFRLSGPRTLEIMRDGPAVERFRSQLFDFGLQFTCKEFRNARRHIERAEFLIRSEISVSVRWRADFDHGRIVLETRNLERLGSLSHSLAPQAVDQALLDAFGRLTLGLPSSFRELLRRT